MLKQLLFKKEYLLGVATIVLLLLSYQLAFKKTIVAWQLNHSLKQQLKQSVDISILPQYQERKNLNLEKIISLYKAEDTLEFRNKALNNIAAIAEKENVKLTGVPGKDPLYSSSLFIIQRLIFEGSYFSLTKMLDRLQQAKGIGMVRSVYLKSATDFSDKEKTTKLVLEVCLEAFNK